MLELLVLYTLNTFEKTGYSIKKEITNPIILNDVSEEDDIYDFVNKLNNKYKEIA